MMFSFSFRLRSAFVEAITVLWMERKMTEEMSLTALSLTPKIRKKRKISSLSRSRLRLCSRGRPE